MSAKKVVAQLADELANAELLQLAEERIADQEHEIAMLTADHSAEEHERDELVWDVVIPD